MSPGTDAYRDLFVQEAREHLETLAEGLTDLLEDPQAPADKNELFRAAHSLKGMAATLGHDEQANLAHALEDHLDRLRAGKTIPLQPLLDAVELLRESIEAIARDRPSPDLGPAIDGLRQTTGAPPSSPTSGSATTGPQAPVAEQEPDQTVQDDDKTDDGPRPRDAGEDTRRTSSLDPAAASYVPASVRVDASRLDAILDRTATLRIAHDRLERLLMEQRRESPGYALTQAFGHLQRQIHTLYQQALDLRTLPATLVTRPLARRVRQTASRHDKKVHLTVQGEDTQLDRSLLEALGDPLLHLLTNAVVHGIEPPEERRRQGKPAEGNIEVQIGRDGDTLRVVVRDDGSGIDLEAARDHAVKQGLATPEEAQTWSPDALLESVTRSGFTTTTEVSQEAGRGVGLDAVIASVRRVGGQVHVETRQGEGTRVTLTLPPTLSLIEVVPITVHGHRYAVSTDQVVRVVDVGEGQDHFKARTNGSGEDPVPVVPLERLLGPWPGFPYLVEEGEQAPVIQQARRIKQAAQVPPAKTPEPGNHRLVHRRDPARAAAPRAVAGPGPKRPALLIEADGRRIAVCVDEAHTPEEAIVKPLHLPTGAPAGTNGATVMRDGHVAVLLDLARLVKEPIPPESAL